MTLGRCPLSIFCSRGTTPPKMTRSPFTSALQAQESGRVSALLQKHGGSLPNVDSPDVLHMFASVTANHPPKGSVFVNLRNGGNLKIGADANSEQPAVAAMQSL